MLVLSRKLGTKILVGNDVRITVTHIGPTAVKIGIEAPRWMPVHREEVYDKIHTSGPVPGACREDTTTDE